MAKSMKNMVLLVKQEVTAGVDPVPTPAANSILVRAFTPQMISAEFVERNNIRGYKGNFGSLAVGVHREFEFEVELAGSGTAGTAPKWAPLVMACGFSETLVAITTATYAPISTGDTTVTMYGYLDGLLFKMTNCKGTVSFELNAKQIPVMKFKFLGEYSTATDATFPTGMVFTGFTKPLTVGKVNTPTFTFHGLAAVVQSLSFDVANALVWRDLIGFQGPYSADRKPTGSLTMELAAVAAANFGEIARLGTEGALQVIHGTVAGNIIQVDMPKTQLTSAPTISNDNEIAMLGVQFSINPNAGNDEMVIVAK
jgi:hypothetical protein